MTEAVLGLLLMLVATLALLIIMPPVEMFGRLKDRLRGRTKSPGQPGPEMEEL